MQTDRGLLLVTIAILLVLSVILVRPYIQFVLGAIVLAFVLQPLQDRLSEYVGKTPSALVLVALSVIAFVVPFFVVAAFVAGDVRRLLEALEEGNVRFEVVEAPIEDVTGEEVDIADAARASLEGYGTFDSVLSAFGTLTHLLVGVGLLLFLLFFFVRDSDTLIEWLHEVAPTPEEVTGELMKRFTAITKAVLAGHVLVAIIQGAIAGVGLFAAGVPSAAFWTFVMILLALIPLIGTFAVWAPASLYLFTTGSTVAAIALFVYGIVVVGISDEYLRPLIVDRYASISPSVILVGVIGGISVFGFMGLFVGPIIVGALKETVEVYSEYYDQPHE